MNGLPRCNLIYHNKESIKRPITEKSTEEIETMKSTDEKTTSKLTPVEEGLRFIQGQQNVNSDLCYKYLNGIQVEEKAKGKEEDDVKETDKRVYFTCHYHVNPYTGRCPSVSVILKHMDGTDYLYSESDAEEEDMCLISWYYANDEIYTAMRKMLREIMVQRPDVLSVDIYDNNNKTWITREFHHLCYMFGMVDESEQTENQVTGEKDEEDNVKETDRGLYFDEEREYTHLILKQRDGSYYYPPDTDKVVDKVDLLNRYWSDPEIVKALYDKLSSYAYSIPESAYLYFWNEYGCGWVCCTLGELLSMCSTILGKSERTEEDVEQKEKEVHKEVTSNEVVDYDSHLLTVPGRPIHFINAPKDLSNGTEKLKLYDEENFKYDNDQSKRSSVDALNVKDSIYLHKQEDENMAKNSKKKKSKGKDVIEMTESDWVKQCVDNHIQSYLTEVANLKENCLGYERKISRMSKVNDDLTVDYQLLLKENHTYELEQSTLKKQLKEKSEKIEYLQSERTDLIAELDRLYVEYNKLLDNVDNAKNQERAKLEREHNDKLIEVHRVHQRDYRELEKKYDLVNQELELTSEELDKTIKLLEEQDAEIDNLHLELKTQQEDLLKRASDLEHYMDCRNQLLSRVNQLSGEAISYKEQIALLKSTIESSSTEIDYLRDELDRSYALSKAKSKKIDELESELAECTAELECIEEEEETLKKMDESLHNVEKNVSDIQKLFKIKFEVENGTQATNKGIKFVMFFLFFVCLSIYKIPLINAFNMFVNLIGF